MRYEVYGPFWAPRVQGEASTEGLRMFWDVVEDWEPGLARAVGVYVFSTCHGETFTPWYVGKTCAKTGFRGEIFQTHKLNHYLSASMRKRGAPALHLIPRVEANRGNFSRASATAARDVDALETAMIAMALRANPDVRNSKKTWFIRNCRVPGLMGTPAKGRRPDAVATLRNAFHL